MQQLIRALSDVYNFIECPNIHSLIINIELLDEFAQVHQLLKNFFERDSNDPRQIFLQLQQYITMQQDVFGPKKFIRMIEAISAVTFQYILTQLREGILDKAVLCLTYFERSCNRYFTNIIKVNISFIYALAHLKKKNFSMAEQYIHISSHILKVEEKMKKGDSNINNLLLISSIFDSITNYQKGTYSKAKCILSDIISKVTSKIQEERAKLNKISLQTISLFILSTYYMSKVYVKINAADISAYNLTQCLQFAAHYYHNPEPLITRCTQSSNFLIKKSVKLSRIQHKIQKIKSLHSINSFLPNQTISQHDKHKKRPSFKISKINHDNNQKQKKISKELNRLFIVDEKSEAQLKKRTLNALRIENQQKQKKISEFKHQMYEFEKQKQQIILKYQNQLYQNELNTRNMQKINLKNHLFNGVWNVVGTLKQTKKIESYLKCFKTAIQYERVNKFMQLMRENVNLQGQLKVFCFLNKYKTHLHRQLINALQINNVKHQIQYLVHKINKTCHIKVYQIQKGTGVNQELVVSQQDYYNIKKEPLSLYFEVVDSKIMPMVNYILTLKKSVQYRMKIFAIRLKNKLKRFRGELYHRKQTVSITFNTYNTELQYTLFISSKKLADGTFSHTLERIDTFKYWNTDYNILFRKNIISEQSQLCESELSQLLTAQILLSKAKHIKSIIRLQDCLRLRLSIRHMKTLKQTISVKTTIINKNIFTFVQRGNERIFYIENLQKKYPIVIVKNVSFTNISFINKLRSRMSLIDDCNLQLLLINKYFKLRQFAIKLIQKSKEATLNSRFQSKFKKSLCFAKFMDRFLYKGKYLEGKVMFMLIVKDFQSFPRPYLLRVFTIQNQSIFSIDFQKIIYSSEKVFLQNNLARINQFIDVQGVKEANVLLEGPPISVINKLRRSNSKSTIVSNYTFGCGDDSIKQTQTQKTNSKMMGQSRLSHVNSHRRNSINFKMRHKSALKQRDIMLIKKWIEDSKEDSQSQQSSRSNSS